MIAYRNASDSPRKADDNSPFWNAVAWVVDCIAALLPFAGEAFLILAGIVTIATMILKTVKL